MINKAILIGNLGADPEVRYTQSGSTVANFNMATNERWKDQNGEQQEQVEWHRVIAFGRKAEICEEFLAKGSKIYIEGRIQTRKWGDKDGVTRFATEIVARTVTMLDTKGGGSSRPPEPPPPEPGEETSF